MAPRRLAPSSSPTAQAKTLPVARSASHMVYLIKGSARLLELQICQLVNKPQLQASQLVSLRAAMVGLQVAWDAVLPHCLPTQSAQVPPEPHGPSPVEQVSCWHGVHCWRPHCPYRHPGERSSLRQRYDRAPGYRDAFCVPPPEGVVAPAEVASASMSGTHSAPGAAHAHHGAMSSAGANSLVDPVAGALQSAASCDNTLPTCVGAGHASVTGHEAEPANVGSNSDSAPPELGRIVVANTLEQDALYTEEDADLAEAIALSLRVSANTTGMPTNCAYDNSRQHYPREADPASTPCSAQRSVDATRRSRQRVRAHRSTPGRASVLPARSSATSPLCGDCCPPASWRLHFGADCCSRCHARVDVVFKP